MRDADQMTPEELIALAQEKAIQNRKKVGFLKHNLYQVIPPSNDENDYPWAVTKEKAEQFIKKFSLKKAILFKKGTKFTRYDNGNETWWEDENGPDVINGNENWAKAHLENIHYQRLNKSCFNYF